MIKMGGNSGILLISSSRDTDSIMLASDEETLEAAEKKDLTPEQRAEYRRNLYGSPNAYNYGRVKLEWTSSGLTVLGAKSYFATNKSLAGESTIAAVKIKGCQTKSRLTHGMLTTVSRRKALIRERTPRIRRTAFGVR